jgi:uncharacterized protein (TIRG00374 family)
MTRPGSAARAWILNATLLGVGLGLLGLAIYSNRDQLSAVLRQGLDPRYFVTALAIYLTATVLTFLRWFVLVRALGLPFRIHDALRLGFIGYLFNLVIPGAVGGDVVKAAYLCREQARKTQAVASMVIDRAVGLLGLFLLASLSGLAAISTAPPPLRRLVVLVWAMTACGVVGLAILFTPALYRPLLALVARSGRLEQALAELVAMASTYRARLGTIIATLVGSTLIHGLYVLAFYLVSRSLFAGGSMPSFLQHLLVVPLALFSTAIPLPLGALGLSEQVSQELFELVGHPGGAIVMMGFRVLMYAVGVLGAGVYLANVSQVRDLKATSETA